MDEQILFIVKGTLFTGAIYKIRFVTSNGNVYECPNQTDSNGNRHEDLSIPFLMNIVKSQKPLMVCDKNEILRAYSNVSRINENSEIMYIHIWTDAGQTTLLANYHDKLIPLSTTGGVAGSVDSVEVKEILNILEKNKFYTWECGHQKYSMEYIKERFSPLCGKYKIFKGGPTH